MPVFGPASKSRLAELHPDLQRVLLAAIQVMDFSIVCGYRGKEDQEQAVRDGKSKLHFPDSKHNTTPSRAADLCPYRGGLRWEDKEAFYLLGGVLKTVAHQFGIKVRWGGDWDGDGDLHDQKLYDLPHVELG